MKVLALEKLQVSYGGIRAVKGIDLEVREGELVCLIGANGGIGISLGDDCVVEAGCYVTAGTKVTVTGDGDPYVVKAAELSGASNVLLRRNSTTGAVEAVPWGGQGIELNTDLHAN